MKYARIAKYVAETPWAILPSKLAEIVSILELHIAGGSFSAEELRARIGEPPQPPASAKRGAVAVLPLHGIIAHRMGGMSEMSGGMSTERFAAMFRQALADESVASILIDVNSPGGSVPGVTELAGEIFAARGQKRIVAHVNAFGASAAYWIASAADDVVATPSGSVGSIGVITAHIDTSKAEEQEGVTKTVFSAGKHKAELEGPLTDEAKAAIQARVDQAYAAMVRDIARGRGVTPAAVRDGYGEGRVLTAKDALAAGMIDRIATFEETVARLTGRGRSAGGMRAEGEPAELGEVDTRDEGAAGVLIAADEDRRRRLERF